MKILAHHSIYDVVGVTMTFIFVFLQIRTFLYTLYTSSRMRSFAKDVVNSNQTVLLRSHQFAMNHMFGIQDESGWGDMANGMNIKKFRYRPGGKLNADITLHWRTWFAGSLQLLAGWAAHDLVYRPSEQGSLTGAEQPILEKAHLCGSHFSCSALGRERVQLSFSGAWAFPSTSYHFHLHLRFEFLLHHGITT